MAWACPVCNQINNDDSLIKCICGQEVEDTKNYTVVLPVTIKIYAGFWKRFAALWIDFLVIVPFFALFEYIEGFHRNISFFTVIPSTLLFWGYSIYFHGRWGATVGKMATKIKVVKTDLTSIGYKESFLRFSVDAFIASFLLIGEHVALTHISIEEFASLGWIERNKRIGELSPPWQSSAELAQNIWMWSEFVVLLLNKKKRALHDFIAGTVVIHKEFEMNERGHR